MRYLCLVQFSLVQFSLVRFIVSLAVWSSLSPNFSKISALLLSLYKVTAWRTFEYTYEKSLYGETYTVSVSGLKFSTWTEKQYLTENHYLDWNSVPGLTFSTWTAIQYLDWISRMQYSYSLMGPQLPSSLFSKHLLFSTFSSAEAKSRPIHLCLQWKTFPFTSDMFYSYSFATATLATCAILSG